MLFQAKELVHYLHARRPQQNAPYKQPKLTAPMLNGILFSLLVSIYVILNVVIAPPVPPQKLLNNVESLPILYVPLTLVLLKFLRVFFIFFPPNNKIPRPAKEKKLKPNSFTYYNPPIILMRGFFRTIFQFKLLARAYKRSKELNGLPFPRP